MNHTHITRTKGWGIDLDAPENGVFLPMNSAGRAPGVNPNSITHRNLTGDYYDDVNKLFKNCVSGEEAKQILNGIRTRLLNGTYPSKWSTVG